MDLASTSAKKDPVNQCGLVADLIGYAALLSDQPEKWTATLDLLRRNGVDPAGFEDFETGRAAAIAASGISSPKAGK